MVFYPQMEAPIYDIREWYRIERSLVLISRRISKVGRGILGTGRWHINSKVWNKNNIKLMTFFISIG